MSASMVAVDGDISDLFFNYEHNKVHDEKGRFIEFADLEGEALQFLACMARLGVMCPTVPELVADFLERV